MNTTSTHTASDGVKVFVAKWTPESGESGAKAVVHIAHGMGEHCLRYDRLAQALTGAGYIVYANDHRGHGNTIPYGLGHALPDGPPADGAAQDGFMRIVEDLNELVQSEKEAHPNLPFLLLGHSMGSVIAQVFAGRYGDCLTGLVLSGAPARPHAVLSATMPLLFSVLFAKSGAKGTSDLLRKLSFEEFNKKFAPNRTEFDWLSRDTAEVDKYIADTLCGFDMSIGFWKDFLANLVSLKDKDTHANLPLGLPVFVMLGDNDPCCGTTVAQSAAQIRQELVEAGKIAPKVTLYPGARHEIFNETNREEVTSDLIGWLDRATGNLKLTSQL